MDSKYNFTRIATLRAQGLSWPDVAEELEVECTGDAARKAFNRWKEKTGSPNAMGGDTVALLRQEDIERITTLEDLVSFFNVDTEKWQVRNFRINKWEQHSVKEGITPLYQVRANLERNKEHEARVVSEILERAADDLCRASEEYEPPELNLPEPGHPIVEDPTMMLLAVFDPHLGMYAWGKEVLEPYDSDIGRRDYREAVESLLATSPMYNIEKIVYVVGNDLLHVDAPGVDSRGGTRGGATTSGTMQDFDSRLAKVFTEARRAVVDGVNMARQIAPVKVLIVPGNHDEQSVYKLGEVLAAWFRNDPMVEVCYDPSRSDQLYQPRRRKYYGYGENAFMFCHGTEYKRKRDNLPLIFSTDCPADIWDAEHREVITGHNHIRKEGGVYQPDSELYEERAIITRSLPGLTPDDSWHYNQGYKHRRGATAIYYREAGGVAGLHEFNL